MEENLNKKAELIDRVSKIVLKSVDRELFKQYEFARFSFSRDVEVKSDEATETLCKDTGLLPYVVVYVYMTNGFLKDEIKVKVALQKPFDYEVNKAPASIVLPLGYTYDTAYRIDKESFDYIKGEFKKIIEIHANRIKDRVSKETSGMQINKRAHQI